jgi:S1-C subfamily serine protease
MSGIGGWIMGYDLGQREAYAELLPEVGVLVTRVEDGSPADHAGISRSDTIIALNGTLIEDARTLHRELQRYQPDEEVQITFRQNLIERTTTVRLGQVPGGDGAMPYLGIYYTARAESPADA